MKVEFPLTTSQTGRQVSLIGPHINLYAYVDTTKNLYPTNTVDITMNTPTIAVANVNPSEIVQDARFSLKVTITPGHVADRTWDRKRLIEARIASGIDKKVAVAEFNAALDSHRSTMKAQVAAILSKSDAVVTRIRNLKTGAMTVTVENHESKRLAAEAKIRAKIAALEALLAAK